MDFRQRLEQSRMRPAGNETSAATNDNFTSPFFSIDRTGNPTCLELRLPEGKRSAIPYSFFTGINFDIEYGIEILTVAKKVTITGRNLLKLFESLLLYRVKYIETNVGTDGPDDQLFIWEIIIDDRDML